ncbi:MAG: hypothetical protein WAZ30_08045 [Syntrophorhabdus sp.]
MEKIRQRLLKEMNYMFRPRKYREKLIAQVCPETRRIVEDLAIENRTSLSDVTRELLCEAIRARGLTV